MKFRSILAVILSWAIPSLVSGQTPYLNPRIDATTAGVKRAFDYSAAYTNSKALDTLLSAPVGEANTTATTTNKTVYFPGATFSGYYFQFPIWQEYDYVHLVGDGMDYTQFANRGGYPVIINGLKRNPNGHVLTAQNFVDLASIIPNAPKGPDGKAYGFRTWATSMVAAPGSSGAHGPNVGGWPAVKQLSISFSGSFGPTTWNGPLFGISEFGQPGPFVFHRQNNGIVLYFRTADKVRRQCMIMTPTASGPFDMDVELDLGAATINAWVKGTQVQVLDQGLGADFKSGNTLSLIDNDRNVAFMMGSEGNGLMASDSFGACTDQQGNFLTPGYQDLSVYGLAVRNKNHYLNGGVGTSRKRIDGVVENDYGRFYSGEDAFWYYWPGMSIPDTIQFRCLPFEADAGVAGQYALWLDQDAANIGYTTTKSTSIEQMSIFSGGARSMTVMVGHALDFHLSDLHVDNGWDGVGAINLGANYPNTMSRCTLGGYDAGAWLYYGIWTVDNLQITRGFRAGLRTAGSNLTWRDGFIAGNGTPKYGIYIGADSGGGNYLFENVTVDNEGGTAYVGGAGVYCEAHSWNPGYMTFLTMHNCDMAIPTSSAGVMLKDMGPSTPSGRLGAVFNYRGLNFTNVSGSPVISTDGPLWSVVGYQEGLLLPWMTGPGTNVVTPRAPVPPMTKRAAIAPPKTRPMPQRKPRRIEDSLQWQTLQKSTGGKVWRHKAA